MANKAIENLFRNANISNGRKETVLPDNQEMGFRLWALQNAARVGGVTFPGQAQEPSDYDYRGFYKQGLMNVPGLGPVDLGNSAPSGHFTDQFKTPAHQSFSNESEMATKQAPGWVENNLGYALVKPNGDVTFQEGKNGKPRVPYR